MRYLLVLIMAAAIALPVQAANAAGNTASVGDSQGVAAPAPRKAKAPHDKKQAVAKLQEVDSVSKALTAPNKSPALIVGTIVEKVDGQKNHYIVEDGTGRMIWRALYRPHIPAHGGTDVTPHRPGPVAAAARGPARAIRLTLEDRTPGLAGRLLAA